LFGPEHTLLEFLSPLLSEIAANVYFPIGQSMEIKHTISHNRHIFLVHSPMLGYNMVRYAVSGPDTTGTEHNWE